MSSFQPDINYAPIVAPSILRIPKNPAGAQDCKDFKNKGCWVCLETPADVLSHSTAISSSSSYRRTTSCSTLPDTRNCHFTGHVNCSMSVACTQTNKLLSDELHVSAVTTCHHQAVPTEKMLQFLCVLHLDMRGYTVLIACFEFSFVASWDLTLDRLHYTLLYWNWCISIVKPTRCTISQIYFILEQHCTCFGPSLRPSWGV